MSAWRHAANHQPAHCRGRWLWVLAFARTTSRVSYQWALRRADLAEEVADLVAELAALGFQRFRRLLDVVGRSGRGVGVSLHARDVVGDVLGALRGILRAARDLLRRRALLLHGGRDRGRHLVDLADDAADGLD